MTYSKNPRAILIVKDQLDQLVPATNDITWITDDPVTLAYRLRQAFNVAQSFKTNFSQYSKLKDQYIIKVERNRVTAKLRIVDAKPLVLDPQEFKKSIPKLTSPLTDVFSMVGLLIANQYEEVWFNEAELSSDDLTKLYKWTSSNGYSIINGNGITVTKKDCGELEWKPKEQKVVDS